MKKIAVLILSAFMVTTNLCAYAETVQYKGNKIVSVSSNGGYSTVMITKGDVDTASEEDIIYVDQTPRGNVFGIG